jgi:hypothetical protein
MGSFRWQWYYNKTQHTTLKQNTAHKITQTIRDTLHPMNTMQYNCNYNKYNYILELDHFTVETKWILFN